MPEQDYPINCTLPIRAPRAEILEVIARFFVDRPPAHWDEPGIRPSKAGTQSGWIIEMWEVDTTVPRDSGGYRLIPVRTQAGSESTTFCFRACPPATRAKLSTDERFVQAFEEVNTIMAMFTTLSLGVSITPRGVQG